MRSRAARAFAAAGCDLDHVSTGQTVADAQPVFGRMLQTPFSDQIRNDAGLATMCVGAITTADQVNTIVAAGRADLVALARPHLVDPYFTIGRGLVRGVRDPLPASVSRRQGSGIRNSARDRDDLRGVAVEGEAQGHRDIWNEAAE